MAIVRKHFGQCFLPDKRGFSHCGTCGFENSLLLLAHAPCGIRPYVIVAGQMEKPVDAIQRELGGDIMAELGGPFVCSRGADQNLPVWKRDHVGAPADTEKLAVDTGHRAMTDNHAFDVAEIEERAPESRGAFHAQRQGVFHKLNEPVVIVADQSLPRNDADVRHGESRI